MVVEGADPDALTELGRAMASASEALSASRSAIDVALAATWWMGRINAVFRSAWLGDLAPGLTAAAEQLGQASADLHDHAAQQNRASSHDDVGAQLRVARRYGPDGADDAAVGGSARIRAGDTHVADARTGGTGTGDGTRDGARDGADGAGDAAVGGSARPRAGDAHVTDAHTGDAYTVDTDAAGAADPPTPRSFLLWNTSGDGRAIEVFGDLTTAKTIGVWVPGVGTTIAAFQQPDNLAASRIHQLRPGMAVIEWLGYDPPDTILEASLELGSGSSAAAADLNDFVANLRADLPGGASRTIVIGGHSYGALVAAKAAALGTSADRLVIAGAPGVPARAAPDLMLNGVPGGRRNVFVAANPLDPVRLGSFADDVIDGLLHAVGLRHPGSHTLWSQMYTDPAGRSFGATVLEVDRPTGSTSGLHQYTTPGSISLRSISGAYAGSDESGT